MNYNDFFKNIYKLMFEMTEQDKSFRIKSLRDCKRNYFINRYDM